MELHPLEWFNKGPAYGGHAGHGEVEGRQIGGEGGRAASDHCGVGWRIQRNKKRFIGSRSQGTKPTKTDTCKKLKKFQLTHKTKKPKFEYNQINLVKVSRKS